MNFLRLGNSDLQISRIGFGCMSLERDTVETVLRQAIERGINFFDTADLYDKGLNEEMVGKALKPYRNQLLIATKVGNQWRADGSGWDWNPRKAHILESVEKSLQRLQTDRIDLYQLHGGTLDDPFEETVEAFEILKQQGKIRYYGISSIRPNVIRKWVAASNIVSVMMQYSLLDRRPEESCFPLLQQHNIGVLARGSIAQGLLVNKPAKAYLGHPEATVAAAADKVRALSTYFRKPAQTALQFVLQQAPVTAAIAGIRTLEQLDEAVGTLDAPPLTATAAESLASVPALHYTDHR